MDSGGVVPVAILTTPVFDVSIVDPGTVRLARAAANLIGKSDKYQASLEDFDNDGELYLILKIVNQLALEEGDSTAVLEGENV